MTDLRDRLDDLVVGVPVYVAGDARKAWRAGRRRLRRRWALTTAAIVALVAVGLATTPGLHQLPAGGEGGSPDYPQRIGHQWWTLGLPDRPGPVAGLLTRDGAAGWYAISPRGELWHLPEAAQYDIYPSLSGNGRYLGYYFNPAWFAGTAYDQGQYVIKDLITGRTTVFAGRQFEEQAPGFWSPDGRRVASLAAPTGGETQAVILILSVDGSTTRVPAPGRDAQLAGWADDATLVWAAGGTAILTSLDGVTRSMVSLQPAPDLDNGTSQYTAVVSGDQLIYRDAAAGTIEWHTFRLSDGVEANLPAVSDGNETCPVTFQRGTPVVPHADAAHMRSLSVLGGHPLVVVDPSLDATCIYLASGAIDGEASGALFGRTQAAWSWWWREILAGLGFVVLVGTAAMLIRRWGLPAIGPRRFGLRGWIGGPPWIGR